jgi:ligand-binding sensor domain-containing protein
MTKYNILKPIYSLLLVLTFLTSCNGQTKTKTSTDNQSETITNPIGQPKLINTQGSQANDNVHCGLQDKTGDLWFGTTGSGVYRYDGKLFYNYTTKDGLNSNAVWSILEDKSGNIWFGTSDGICRFDGKKIIPFPINDYIRPIPDKNDFYSDWAPKTTVWSMLQDKTGKIWFGTGDGVYCYDGISLTRFLNNDGVINKNSLQLKMVDCMLEDKSGNIWFASGMPPGGEGICRYDGKTVENFKPNNEGWIRTITEVKNGTLLFATRHNGVLTYDGKNFTSYSKPEELRNDLINTIFVDRQNNIWYASDYVNDNDFKTGGVWKSDGKSFIEFTKKDGLTNTSPFLVMEDSAGNIWFGTRNTGLYKYDGKHFTNYSE